MSTRYRHPTCKCTCRCIALGWVPYGRARMPNAIRNGVPAARLTGAVWRKSRHSGQLGNCVEAAVLGGGDVALRNSRHPNGPALVFTRDEMAAFLAGAKDGDFDDVVA